MLGHESKHHMLWPRKDYRGHHDKQLRNVLVIGTDWEAHKELHAQLKPPTKPDIGITLTLIDYLREHEPLDEPAPLYAIDRLLRLGSPEATGLADHLITQLGHLGVGYGRVC